LFTIYKKYHQKKVVGLPAGPDSQLFFPESTPDDLKFCIQQELFMNSFFFEYAKSQGHNNMTVQA
jgi:hypothetical protein